MTQFPVEVLANIIEYCDAASSLQLRLLCRASNQMCNARNLHIVAFRDACQRNFSKAKGSKTKASHWLCCWPAEYQAVAASEFNASDLVHLPCCYHNSPVIPPSLSIATKLTKICIRDASLTAIPRELYDLIVQMHGSLVEPDEWSSGPDTHQ
ncbi:hypothetical protein BDR26DRAFT_1006723 [Obelidium mucronatum]|nr:hypothetical protein BDR26DRAFT_1006723 [Obelidium mucronatum]